MDNISAPNSINTTGGTPSQRNRKKRRSFGWLLAGGTFLAIGGLLMARQLGVDIPNWVFKWEMLVI
ncbi:MAG: hypothetical protein EOO01_11980, partial [Chitinophagaceae bacterium]